VILGVSEVNEMGRLPAKPPLPT